MFPAVILLAASVAAGQADQATSSPSDNHYLAFWKEYFQGNWAFTVDQGIAGDSRLETGNKGTWSCTLSPTERCMLFSAAVNGKPTNNGVAGYDPKSKTWKEVIFIRDGSVLTQNYAAEQGDLAGTPAGKVLKGKAEFVHPDGKIETGRIRLRIVGQDQFKSSVVNRKLEGEDQPTLQWTFERVK
jgi:hypothetical protein